MPPPDRPPGHLSATPDRTDTHDELEHDDPLGAFLATAPERFMDQIHWL